MTPPRLWNLRVPAAAVIGSTIGAGRPVIEGSGPRGHVENARRGILDYETYLNNYLRTARTSTRRLPLYWGTTSLGKMIYVSACAAAGNRLTIVEDQHPIEGSGLPPLAGKEPMRNALETRD